MDSGELAKKYAQNGEDQLLLRRVLDKLEACRRKNVPSATAFLNGHEQALCARMLEALAPDTAYRFDGGYPEAERQVLAFLPDWQTPDRAERPVCALRAAFSGAESLSHRDFLGALMGIGIKRETVGDILVFPAHCDIVLLPELMPYVRQNLESAGRVRLRLEPVALEELRAPERQVKLLRDTVASPRLDSLIAAGFSLSREKAAALVKSGRVSLNFFPCEKAERTLEAGDTVSVQGLGRMEVAELGGSTRKGRIPVLLKRLI